MDPASSPATTIASAPQGSAGVSPATQTPAAPQAAAPPAAPQTAPASAAEPNILQLAMAAAKSKSTLIRDRDEAQTLADQRQTLIEELNGKLATALTERDQAVDDLAEANTQLAQVRDALTASQTEATTTEKAALEIVANLGVPDADSLPEQTAGGDTIADLETQLAATTDSKKRYELAQKINAQLGALN